MRKIIKLLLIFIFFTSKIAFSHENELTNEELYDLLSDKINLIIKESQD